MITFFSAVTISCHYTDHHHQQQQQQNHHHMTMASTCVYGDIGIVPIVKDTSSDNRRACISGCDCTCTVILQVKPLNWTFCRTGARDSAFHPFQEQRLQTVGDRRLVANLRHRGDYKWCVANFNVICNVNGDSCLKTSLLPIWATLIIPSHTVVGD